MNCLKMVKIACPNILKTQDDELISFVSPTVQKKPNIQDFKLYEKQIIHQIERLEPHVLYFC